MLISTYNLCLSAIFCLVLAAPITFFINPRDVARFTKTDACR